MVATGPRIVSRLKREECKRTKHDSAFSKWKILIGPSDWEDHSSGKERAERYRVHNLPSCCHCAGVYELGISASPAGLGREVGKLGSANIVVVYLGQAESIRARLQHYGRSGAHLANVDSTSNPSNGKTLLLERGPRLFEEIFSRGYSIVFRWAPRESKKDAEKTESQLLKTFDYAWNKGSNGARRLNDVLRKLENFSSNTSPFPSIARKFQMLGHKQVGIRIKASKQFLEENGLSTYQDISSLLSRVFKIGRSRPQLVLDRVDATGKHNNICGVALGDGIICERPPVEGRKRCAEHKGMKTKSTFSKLIVERKSEMSEGNQESEGHLAQNFGYNRVNFQLIGGKCSVNENFAIICGVILDDGLPCKKLPVQGRKRCEEHKGMRINMPVSNSTMGKSHHTDDLILKSNNNDKCSVNENFAIICGIILDDGLPCKKLPVQGRKRCEEHKGMRINMPVSNSTMGKSHHTDDLILKSNNNDTDYESKFHPQVIPDCRSFSNKHNGITCGVDLGHGMFCESPAVVGRKRCEEHKGMRINSLISKLAAKDKSRVGYCFSHHL